MSELESIYRDHMGSLERIARMNGASSYAADVVQDVFAMALDRFRRGTLVKNRPLYPYLCAAVRGRARSGRYRQPVFQPHDMPQRPSAVTRLVVKRAWELLTNQERVAIAQLHILEEDVSRADRGVFAARIRVARMRLGAA